MVSALSLWQALLQKEPQLIGEFYKWKDGEVDADEFIHAGIFSFKAEEIRKAYRRTFEVISERSCAFEVERPLYYLLNLLMRRFPTDITPETRDKPDKTSRSNEFFGLFTKLIQ